MPIVTFPLSIRKACLRAHADKVPAKDIARIHGVSVHTLAMWVRKSGIKRGAPLTDAELDDCIANWGRHVRSLQKSKDVKKTKNRRREILTTLKFGPEPQPMQTTLDGPTSVEDYEKVIAGCLAHVAANLTRETSLEGQAKALMLGILFRQMQTLLSTPPTAVTWSDVDRIFNQAKDLLGMNDKKIAGRRIDINILNAKIEQPAPKEPRKRIRSFEAEIVPPPEAPTSFLDDDDCV